MKNIAYNQRMETGLPLVSELQTMLCHIGSSFTIKIAKINGRVMRQDDKTSKNSVHRKYKVKISSELQMYNSVIRCKLRNFVTILIKHINFIYFIMLFTCLCLCRFVVTSSDGTWLLRALCVFVRLCVLLGQKC